MRIRKSFIFFNVRYRSLKLNARTAYWQTSTGRTKLTRFKKIVLNKLIKHKKHVIKIAYRIHKIWFWLSWRSTLAPIDSSATSFGTLLGTSHRLGPAFRKQDLYYFFIFCLSTDTAPKDYRHKHSTIPT